MDMKTSGVPPDRQVQSDTQQSKPKESTGKSGTEFQNLMQHAGKQPAAGQAKAKPFAPMSEKKLASAGKHGQATGTEKSGGQGPSVASRKSTDRELEELEQQKKSKREAAEESQPTVEALAGKGAQQARLQQAQSADKTQRPGLNIHEIESIVNRVSLGVNEKGNPEFQFELKTQNMGNLDLKISAQDDQIRIDFAVHDAATQDLLEQNLQELSDRLREKGLNLAETHFTRQDQSEQQERQQQQQESGAGIGSNQGGPKKVFKL